MREEILLTNLNECVMDRTALAEGAEYNKWLVLPYETGAFNGKMLVAMDNFHPVEVKIDLNVKGWHKIYFGLVTLGKQSVIGVQIGDGGKTIIEPKPRISRWQNHEWIEENFFRAVDLTDTILTFSKPENDGKYFTTGLAYIRLVAMTREEVELYTKKEGGCVAFHFDTDFTHEMDYQTPEEYTGRVGMLENTNGGELFYETSFDDCLIDKPRGYIMYSTYNDTICKRYSQYLRNGLENRQAIIKKSHALGYQIYATNRMEMGDFCFPYSVYTYNNNWGEQYPQYKCRTRDGRIINALSFAYPKVRKLSIQRLMKMLSEGFDGLTLIFHRGVHVAFEQPVVDRVAELYGVDARRLPFADKRLHNVLAEFMNAFMRELKESVENAYGNSKKINAIVYYDAASSKNFGLDTETWMQENLVDGICQGLMTHFEDLSDCLDADGLIDLERFKTENAKRQILNRTFGSSQTMILEGASSLQALCNRYGKQFYGTLLWECDTPDATMEIAQELRKIGVEHFISWNANHKAKDLLLLNTEKAIARQDVVDKQKYIRVLSIANSDISSFNQNWRG